MAALNLSCSPMASLVAFVAVACCVATTAEGSSLGDEAMIGDESGACPTTVTASTTFAVSLMQAASMRARLGSPQLWDAASPQASASSSDAQQDLNASLPVGDYDREGNFRSSLKAAMAAAASFVQEGQTIGRSALDQLAAAPQTLHSSVRGMTLATTGVLLIFTITFLLIVGGFAYILIFYPSILGLQNSLDTPYNRNSDADVLAGARVNDGPRAFYPMTASPQLSIRGASTPGHRGSPESSQKRLVIDPKAVKLVPVRGDPSSHQSSSDEENLAVGASAFSPGSNLESFCPDLVVPKHCECILVLPLRVGTARASFNISDVNGSPVLQATPQPGSAGRPWRATVSTAQGAPLVQCCEARQPGARGSNVEFHFLRADGQKFATLVPAADRYSLIFDSDRTQSRTVSFWGNFENDAVNITDDANRLLATTEVGSTDFDPRGKYCRLRVAPLADVGMALCGLLCIGQHLLMKRSPSM